MDAHDRQRAATEPRERRVISMHENVQVWEDCCCCEAEPYWIEAMAEGDTPDAAGED